MWVAGRPTVRLFRDNPYESQLKNSLSNVVHTRGLGDAISCISRDIRAYSRQKSDSLAVATQVTAVKIRPLLRAKSMACVPRLHVDCLGYSSGLGTGCTRVCRHMGLASLSCGFKSFRSG